MNSGCFVTQISQPGVSNRSVCNYNYAAVSGFSSFDATRGYTYASASPQTVLAQGCSAYSQPVYSETKGLGCVDSRNLTYSGQPAYYAFDGASGQFVLVSSAVGYSQYNGYNGYSTTGWNTGYAYSNAAMYSGNVLRACDSSDPCPSGQICRSPYSDTTVGVCYF
jgi:hypothetical protein